MKTYIQEGGLATYGITQITDPVARVALICALQTEYAFLFPDPKVRSSTITLIEGTSREV